jgi:hypothetical protein
MRRLLGAAAMVAASMLFALAAGELVVRSMFKDQTVIFPRYHTDYRYGEYAFRHTSVDGTWTFVTNSRGFRDTREFAYEKPAGTLRVLALGDSHTQGYEVRQEATYSAVIERYLRRHGVKAEVMNAGVSGYSTAEALALLENEGYKYQPDVVVLGFYANDFEDNLKAALFGLDGGKLVERSRSHLPGVKIQNAIYGVPGVKWLGENSYLYSMAFNGVWAHFKSALSVRSANAGEFEYAVATKKGYSAEEVGLAAALVERMRAFCEARGIRFIVVDIPRTGDEYGFAESIPAGALPGAELVGARALLGPFEGAAALHVPHGHRHISEFTHALIGAELGRRILEKK